MSEYKATVEWHLGKSETFVDNQYSRGHEWQFDGGAVIAASSSPHVVPLPYSVAENVDPEEAFIAALSSCHMLFFLSIAAKKRWVVEKYSDNAYGVMEKNKDAKLAMSKVWLRPQVVFSGAIQPSLEQIQKVHHQSHEQCFIANSVNTEIYIDVIL